MDSAFDFNAFVTDLVISAVQNHPEVQDILTNVATETVEGLVDKTLAGLELVERDEFDELADRVYAFQEDTDVITDSIESLEDRTKALEESGTDLESRVDALEKESVFEEDFERLEKEYIRMQTLFNQFQPLLEALNKAAPLLKMLGLLKAEDVPAHVYQQHPKLLSFGAEEKQAPSINWLG